MLVVCDQCQARYKITVAKTPGKAVTFKCGKCQNLIRLTPEQIEAGSAPATGVRPVAVKARADKPAPAAPAAPPPDAETVRTTCQSCGAAFVKPTSDKSTTCYQCRIDSLVHKVREKYGVTETATAAPAPAPEPAPEAASRFTIRSADGLVLGPIKLRTVAVLAREKRISGREEVSRDDGDFAPLMSYPELAELFPHLKEILDTDGLEDKVDEAFMAAFGADEGVSEATTAAEEDAAISGIGAAAPETPTAPAPPEPTRTPDKPALSIDDLGPEPEPEPEPPAEPTAEEPKAEAPVVAESSVEVESSFKLTDPTGPRRAIDIDLAAPPAASRVEPPASPSVPFPPAPPKPPAAMPKKIVEKSSALETPAANPPAPDEGTEFDVGEEWDGSGEEEEIIEDLQAIEPPPDARYRIRYPDGLMLGPVKFGTIKELFKSGNLTGQEEVQRDEDAWVPFAELPELAVLIAETEPIVEDEVMELTDVVEEK